jgi:hypothetical protein
LSKTHAQEAVSHLEEADEESDCVYSIFVLDASHSKGQDGPRNLKAGQVGVRRDPVHGDGNRYLTEGVPDLKAGVHVLKLIAVEAEVFAPVIRQRSVSGNKKRGTCATYMPDRKALF